MDISFKNKNVLITGAGNGLGFKLLNGFLREGAKVIAIDNNKQFINIIKNKYSKIIGKKIFLHQLDLRSQTEIKNFSKILKKKIKKIDSFIFCAKSILNIKKNNESTWDEIMNVSLKAPMLFVENFKDILIKSKSSVISIGSTNSSYVSHQPLAYHVAKAGLNQLTKYYANIFGKNKIRFNVIEPGLIKTKKIKKKISKINKILIPLQKPAEYSEILDLALFLSSQKSSYITGEIIRIDGGITTSDHPNLVNRVIKSRNKNYL